MDDLDFWLSTGKTTAPSASPAPAEGAGKKTKSGKGKKGSAAAAVSPVVSEVVDEPAKPRTEEEGGEEEGRRGKKGEKVRIEYYYE